MRYIRLSLASLVQSCICTFILVLAHNMTTHSPYPAYPPSSPAVDSNTILNLSVLRRHNPLITSIISTASYAVIYTYSEALQNWEKNGIEGSLFVVQLAAETTTHAGTSFSDTSERYAVTVLNRRGLENFTVPLTSTDDVDIDEEIIQIRGPAPETHQNGDVTEEAPSTNEAGQVAYGVWIFSEPGTSTALTRDLNARVIRDCAASAEENARRIAERLASQQGSMQMGAQQRPDESSIRAYEGNLLRDVGHDEHVQEQHPEHYPTNGRQLSLLELFGNSDGGAGRGGQMQQSFSPPAPLNSQANGLLSLLRGTTKG